MSNDKTTTTTTTTTPEQEAQATITQQPKQVQIGSKSYTAHPATLATIMEVGAIASQIPTDALTAPTDDAGVLAYLLHNAPHSDRATDIITSLIVGAIPQDSPIFVRIWHKHKRKRVRRHLAQHLTPRTAYEAITALLPLIEIEHFFGLTAFLSQLNLIPASREAVTTHGELS